MISGLGRQRALWLFFGLSCGLNGAPELKRLQTKVLETPFSKNLQNPLRCNIVEVDGNPLDIVELYLLGAGHDPKSGNGLWPSCFDRAGLKKLVENELILKYELTQVELQKFSEKTTAFYGIIGSLKELCSKIDRCEDNIEPLLTEHESEESFLRQARVAVSKFATKARDAIKDDKDIFNIMQDGHVAPLKGKEEHHAVRRIHKILESPIITDRYAPLARLPTPIDLFLSELKFDQFARAMIEMQFALDGIDENQTVEVGNLASMIYNKKCSIAFRAGVFIDRLLDATYKRFNEYLMGTKTRKGLFGILLAIGWHLFWMVSMFKLDLGLTKIMSNEGTYSLILWGMLFASPLLTDDTGAPIMTLILATHFLIYDGLPRQILGSIPCVREYVWLPDSFRYHFMQLLDSFDERLGLSVCWTKLNWAKSRGGNPLMNLLSDDAQALMFRQRQK